MVVAGDRESTPGTRRRDLSLVLLAIGAGAVDAISLTVLGVFTAAVTANVVLIGLAFGDADTHTAARAAVAFAAFSIGVLIAARTLGGGAGSAGARPGRLAPVLVGIAAVQGGFLTGWLVSDGHPEGITLDLLAAASGLAMGAQTAAARSWHAAGVTTTYISGTLTLLLADLAASSGSRADRLRRLAVILAVAGGATAGAVILRHARESVPVLPLAITGLVAVTAAAAARGRRRGPSP